MPSPLRHALALLAVLACLPAAHGQALDKGFKSPPVSAWPQVWWHWLNGNVSKEGVTADLEAMKKAGIGGGTIANISYDREGPAPFNTPAWHEVVKHAGKEAARLGLELGFFNCEGWSSSGGPWVTPEQAMQTLVWSETRVTGPGAIRAPQPTTRLGFYRDVALLAFPTPDAEKSRPAADLKPAFSTQAGPVSEPARLTDSDPGTFIETPFDANRNGWLQAAFDQPITIRGFRFVPGPDWTRDDVDFQVSDDGKAFRSMGRYAVPLSFLDAGIEWQITPTFAPVTARFFRLAFHLSNGRTFQADARRNTVAELEFITSTEPRVVPADSIIDLTGKMDAAGNVAWTPPAGDWTILRVGHTAIPKHNHPVTKWGEGLEVDKLDKEALLAHCHVFVDKVLADAGPLVGKTLAYSLIDSYECGDQNWTEAMPQAFRAMRGYDLRKWLPALTGRVVGNSDLTRRFTEDFRRTVIELWNENYYGTFAAYLHEKGLKSSAEAYGNGMFDMIRSSGVSDMPMSEFWFGNGSDGGIGKQAASAAHVYGRPIVGAESFTSGDLWNFDPWSMKMQGDWIYSQGVNRYYFHSYAQQMWADGRKPGWAWGNGIHMTRNLTWWDPGKAYFAYLGRCQYMLQQGKSVADLLCLVGENAASISGDPTTFSSPPTGTDYDTVDRYLLMNGITVRDGVLTAPGGTTYRMLVLPNDTTISLPLLRRVKELVTAGAVVFGPRPNRAYGNAENPGADAEVQALAVELWGDIDGKDLTSHRTGKGWVHWTGDMGKMDPVMDALRMLPDFEYVSDDARLRWLHRRVPGTEIYFVSSQESFPVDVECVFRVYGRQPEIWDAETGAITDAPVWYDLAEGRTGVKMNFEPGQSYFVVFRRFAPRTDHATRLTVKPAGADARVVHKLEIKRAVYVAQDGFGAPLDLTARVAERVAGGRLRMEVTNTFAGSDPAPLHVKQMRVDYVLDGKEAQVLAAENAVLRIPAARPEADGPTVAVTAIEDGVKLVPWQAAEVQVRFSSGKPRTCQVKPLGERAVAGAWQVEFDPKWGGPGKVTFNTLEDWTKRTEDGIRHYSGTAVYRKVIDVPADWVRAGRAVSLDLGGLANLAQVSLNGKDLGVLWKPPYRVEISGAIKPGANQLVVKVTNLWANRLIGDAALPAGKRVATTTHNPYAPNTPLQECGLYGPVVLRAADPVIVK